MCFAITIVEEGISFRPFSPPSPSTKTQNINLGFSNDHVGQVMYKQLFEKPLVKNQGYQCISKELPFVYLLFKLF